jgi:hypothetical protein
VKKTSSIVTRTQWPLTNQKQTKKQKDKQANKTPD